MSTHSMINLTQQGRKKSILDNAVETSMDEKLKEFKGEISSYTQTQNKNIELEICEMKSQTNSKERINDMLREIETPKRDVSILMAVVTNQYPGARVKDAVDRIENGL